MVVENLLKEKIGEYLLKKYSIPNTPVEIIKTRKEFKGNYTVVLFPIFIINKTKTKSNRRRYWKIFNG